MEQWLALSTSAKLLNIGLLTLVFGLFSGTLFMFLKFLIGKKSRDKGVKITTPIGAIDTTSEESSQPAQHVNINLMSPKAEESHPTETSLYAEECDDEDQRYEAPRGVPSFNEHRFFKLMAKSLTGRIVVLKSRYNPTELQEIKNLAFSYLLFDCMTKVFKDMMDEFVNDCLCTFGSRQTISSIMKKTLKAMDDYEILARKAQVELDNNRILLNIPEIMISAFREWNQSYINIILDKLESVVESQFYPSWQLKLITILDTYEAIFSVIFDHSEYALMDLNGELDSAIKKNIVYRSLQ